MHIEFDPKRGIYGTAVALVALVPIALLEAGTITSASVSLAVSLVTVAAFVVVEIAHAAAE